MVPPFLLDNAEPLRAVADERNLMRFEVPSVERIAILMGALCCSNEGPARIIARRVFSTAESNMRERQLRAALVSCDPQGTAASFVRWRTGER
jgi:hypothetical protein